MLNQVVLVGRVQNLQKEFKDGKDKAKVILAVGRNYKNTDGIYETDFISIDLWDNMAQNILEYCKIGDVIGIKGFLETEFGNIVVKASKVTFLSSKGGVNNDN